LQEGKIVKAAGGFFSVRDSGSAEYICRARGMLKRDKASLMVGDLVLFAVVENATGDDPGEGVIEKLLPRKNRLRRPPVANVEQLVVVMSLRHPECDWQLISRLMVIAEQEELAALLCLNKIDLLAEPDLVALDDLLKPYPYPVILTSALSGAGIEALIEKLSDSCSVFAGPSGVGKSSLLNAVQPGLSLQTGEVSEKIKRGRHTTRQAELLSLKNGGTVVDTPGFSRLDFFAIEPGRLAHYFPEFETLRGCCGFRDCRHISETDCAVRNEIGKTVNPMRYEHYCYFARELEKQEAY
jgi:ribosome biogenesis GTPase / thiamine phosphate phosphatase